MELGHYHFTLEQGGTTFKDDQGASDVTRTAGSFIGPFLGQNLSLNSLSELYRVRGDSIYTRVLLAANPYSWMSVTGSPIRTFDFTTSGGRQRSIVKSLISGIFFRSSSLEM